MTKIFLGNDTYITSALGYAKEGFVTKALTLLGKCDSYEGHINRIVLLFLRGDFAIANNELAYTIAQYGKKYNVYPDVIGILSRYDASCISRIDVAMSAVPAKSKKCIGEDKVVVINDDELEGPNEIFEEEIDFFELAELIHGHRMYDIHSAEYLNFLKYKAYLMYAEDRQGEANKIIEQILDTDTSDVEMLMWKIMVLSNVQEYDKAMNIAEKIYDKIEDISQLGYIAECIRQGCGNKDMLRYVIDKILTNLDQCSSDRIVLLMRICNDYLVDYRLASQFAQFLLSNYQYFPIDSMRDAVWVFLNAGDVDGAKQTATALLSSVPGDVWATTIIRVLPLVDRTTITTLATVMAPISVRSYALPRVITNTAVKNMSTLPPLDDSVMAILRGVASHCKVLSRDSQLTTALIDGIMFQIDKTILDESNISLWVEFVSSGLLKALYPIDIMLASVMRLVDYGYNGKLYVNLGSKVYLLDVQLLAGVADDKYLLSVMTLLCLVGNMTAGKFAKYLSYYDVSTTDSCYHTALMWAKMAGVKVSKGALEEISEVLLWLDKDKHTTE